MPVASPDRHDTTWDDSSLTPGRRLNNWTATVAPTMADDANDHYEVGSRWVVASLQEVYTCVSSSVGAAIWVKQSSVAGSTTGWLNGAGVPAVGLGVNGDYYINTTNGDFYYKSAGAWTMVGNLKGPAGATGSTGATGAAGGIGPTGAIGPTGPVGATGAAGPTGPKGDTGSQGPPGFMGLTGPTGPAGAAGADGADGADSTVPGPPGEQGEPGPQGIQGVAGPPGADGPEGATGPEGPQGIQGPIGLTGPEGPEGDPGQASVWHSGAGAPSAGLGNDGEFYLDTTTNHWYIKSGGVWSDQGEFSGAEGPVGPQGPIGPTGPQGVQGDPGAQGTQGIQGVKGDTGDIGPQGPVGTTGATGASGAQGETGPTGATGPEGPQGPIGLTGAQGPIGPEGPQGEPGTGGGVGDHELLTGLLDDDHTQYPLMVTQAAEPATPTRPQMFWLDTDEAPPAVGGAIDWGEDADISGLDYGGGSWAGVLDEGARADHTHGMPTAPELDHGVMSHWDTDPAAPTWGDALIYGGDDVWIHPPLLDHSNVLLDSVIPAGVARDSEVTSAVSAHAATPHGEAIPSGVIVMWAGLLSAIPSGWRLCDGTGGAPDLRSRFIMGTAAGVDPGGTGGALTHGHTVTQPANHAALSHSAHSGATVGDHASILNHVHVQQLQGGTTGINSGTHIMGSSATSGSLRSAGQSTLNPTSVGTATMSHTVGQAAAHTDHAAQSHTGAAVDTVNHQPPYYALAFIQKV